MLLVFLINPRIFISCAYNYSLNGDFANSYIFKKYGDIGTITPMSPLC